MEAKKGFNQVIKFKPQYIKSVEDVQKAADFLKRLKEFKEAVRTMAQNEKEELLEKIAAIDKKYGEILEKIDEAEGEVRGKVTHYADSVIDSGELLEKRIRGEVATITFVANKDVEVIDFDELIKAVANSEYPTTLLQPRVNEIKKYAKATGKNVKGCNIRDTVYFRVL